MSTTNGALLRTLACVSAVMASSVLIACTGDSSSPSGPDRLASAAPSKAFGIWKPGPTDSCSPEIHDRYATIGPDGKKYPTWHPPVDLASGCSFGHEHGRDPRGSNLYREVGDLPFAYANEQLDASGLGIIRHEDHFGHKVEWENGLRIKLPGAAGTLLEISCDVLVKLHQGTHSKDAFTNNLHELIYHIRCSDHTEMHVTLISAIGRPGEFERSCGGTVVVGPATPPNSPAGGGQRRIPERSCVEPRVLVASGQRSDFGSLHESWETHNEIRTAEGKRIALFNPYFQVFRPSRFYDAAAAGIVGRPVDLCAMTMADGRRAHSDECAGITGGAPSGIGYDDPRSPFNGSGRQVDINDNVLSNAGGGTVWYTDAFGNKGRPAPFPGSIRQYVAAISNDYGVGVNGPVIGGDRTYGGAGTRAPN